MGPPFCDRAGRMIEHAGRLGLEEFARFRQDQIGLEHLAAGVLVRGGKTVVVLVHRIVHVDKVQPGNGVHERRHGLCEGIAHLVVPQREMVDLHSADAAGFATLPNRPP